MKMRQWSTLFIVLLLCACQSKQYPTKTEESKAPLLEDVRSFDTPETEIYEDINGLVRIDYSHGQDGYICAKLKEPAEGIKLQIIHGEETYTYDVTETDYLPFPLQLGDGTYRIKIMQRVEGTTYANIGTLTLETTLLDPLSPFLMPNQIVLYTKDDRVVQKAFELTKDDRTAIQRIHSIYEYVITTISYDDDRAEAVKGHFVLPDIEGAIEAEKGICFDYAAILTAMLRSQQIPARLITGYTEDEYHSWVQVWLEDEGWIDPHVYFEKEEWTTMDPTYAAAKKDYNGEYKVKYIY